MRRALAPLLATLLAMAGCGSQEPRTIPAGELVGAVDGTRSAPSQRMHIDMTLSTLGLEARITGTGVFDNRVREGRMTFDMSQLADVAGRDAGPDGDSADLVTIGRTAWVRWPVLADRLGTDAKWLEFAPRKETEQRGIDFAVVSAGLGDPGPRLDQLRAAGGDFEAVGDENVRGVATTHYRAAGAEAPTEVWVGHDTGRVHRLRTRTQVELLGRPVEVGQTIELYDFGAPVGHVLPPPASATADLAEP